VSREFNGSFTIGVNAGPETASNEPGFVEQSFRGQVARADLAARALACRQGIGEQRQSHAGAPKRRRHDDRMHAC